MTNDQIIKEKKEEGFKYALESGKHGGTFFYTEEAREESEKRDCSIKKVPHAFVKGVFISEEEWNRGYSG